MNPSVTRRRFLAASAAFSLASASPLPARPLAGLPRVLVFTKHLAFIRDYDELAAKVREIGYDGLDLTVRPKGHVLPENVRADLPRAFEAARKAGLSIDMITTDIDKASPRNEAVVETAASLGIRLCRIGGWDYPKDMGVVERLDAVRRDLAGIAEMTAGHGVCAVYQNHSGADRVGAPLWDLWEMLKGLDHASIAVNFDIGHATVEGGQSWPVDFRLLQGLTRAVTIKDFKWEKGSKDWRPAWCPLGEGMVNLDAFLAMLRAGGYDGPVTQHFEYKPRPEAGQEPDAAMLAAMRRDLGVLRSAMAGTA